MNRKRIGIILLIISMLWFILGWILLHTYLGPHLLHLVPFDAWLYADSNYFDMVTAIQDGLNLFFLLLGILGISFYNSK